MPLGFKTGAGVIFGASGGVTEAVLRYAVEKLEGVSLDAVDFLEVRGTEGIREAVLTAGGVEMKLAVVHGLKNARDVVEKVRRGESRYDLIEVMACPGGCVCGAGQPVTRDAATGRQRAQGLYSADKMMQLHKSQDNHMVAECYAKYLEEPGSRAAHKLLHTAYQNRRRISGDTLVVLDDEGGGSRPKLEVSVCVGTSCFLRGRKAAQFACPSRRRGGTRRCGEHRSHLLFREVRSRADRPRRRGNHPSLQRRNGLRGHSAAIVATGCGRGVGNVGNSGRNGRVGKARGPH